ncbi:MAG TPA: nitrite/sulfite reductase [Kofleriaceae bacterium]|jgi:sulfite reductase (NADPH) hemoprotein beta-component
MSTNEAPDRVPVGRLGFARREDVDLFVERLEAFERGELDADAWRSFRLLNGVYGQRQDGVMMIRAKLPGGIATPQQLRALADVAERHGGGKGHVTTRQNVQFHFVPMADVESALTTLAGAGITTKEACGNSVRNWTLCPFAGVAAGEPFDPTPYLDALARHLLRGPYSSTLPRKLKPSVGGCCGTDCSQAFINDLGFLARTRDGAIGFQLIAGGGLSTLRRSALVVEEFVPAGEILEAADAIVRVFHRIGNRHNRAKARLKWAIDKIGKDAFLAEYRAERELIRGEGGVPLVLPPQPEAPVRRVPLALAASDADPAYAAWAADSVRPQKQAGFSTVVIRLVLGDVTAAQLRALAEVAVGFGEGELRLSNDQNVVLRYVPAAKLPALHRELARVGLAKSGAQTLADVTSCPGASSCKLAVTASRGLAGVLVELLERRPDLVAAAKGLDVKVSGCPHGCGQHYVAGIGFQGGMRKIAGKPAPQYLVYVGGGFASDRADFGRLIGKVPARRAGAVLERLVDFYVAAGARDHTFWTSVSGDVLKSLIADLEKLGDADATPDDFIDLGTATAFEVATTEGECSV